MKYNIISFHRYFQNGNNVSKANFQDKGIKTYKVSSHPALLNPIAYHYNTILSFNVVISEISYLYLNNFLTRM